MSVTVTAEDVTNVATEFATESEDRISLFIAYASELVEAGISNEKFAIILLTAHFLTLAARGGNGGAIQSEKIGDLATSYFGSANSGGLDDDLKETGYGKMYLRVIGDGSSTGGVGVCVV